MVLKNEYKDMTQFCLDAERWSAAAGSICTVPERKIKVAVTNCYTSQTVLKLKACQIKFQGGQKICLTAQKFIKLQDTNA